MGTRRYHTHVEAVVRSQGVNQSEAILAGLCDHAFLPLWCYPNLYRAKNKELTDVLVVFGVDEHHFASKSEQPARGEAVGGLFLGQLTGQVVGSGSVGSFRRERRSLA